MLLVADLAAKNSGFLYIFILNNSLKITLLFINDLANTNS